MTKELAKTLTTALVQFIDRDRPEGTMCCSNIECGALEEAFKSDNFNDVEAFIQKKLTRLTKFEDRFSDYLKNDFEFFATRKWDEQKWNEVIRKQSKELLTLAKKELCPFCDEHLKGFSEGYDKANEVKSYRFPPNHIWSPLCWEPGGTCTNPHMDCFNCPRKTTGGRNLKTSSGTSISNEEG